MKKLTTKVLSFILTLSMIFSLNIPVFASEDYSNVNTSEPSGSQEEIEAAREAYNSLTPEAKAIFDASLANDPVALEFHKTYIDKSFYLPTSRIQTSSAKVAASTGVNYVANLMSRLNSLNLPASVLAAFRAMGASIAADIADGPLPIGTVLVAASTAAVITTVALNWDVVSPKLDQISKAFQATFAEAASNISSAFSKIKGEAKKEADKNKEKEKKPTGNKVKDVQQRLKREGFQKTGQSGSHEKWKKGNRTVTVPNHGPNHEIPIGTLRNIWRQAGWIN